MDAAFSSGENCVSELVGPPSVSVAAWAAIFSDVTIDLGRCLS